MTKVVPAVVFVMDDPSAAGQSSAVGRVLVPLRGTRAPARCEDASIAALVTQVAAEMTRTLSFAMRAIVEASVDGLLESEKCCQMAVEKRKE